MTALLLALVSPGHAFECIMNSTCGCDWADGSQATYHINVNDFSTAEENVIERSAEAWNAGSGEYMRGADWEFVRGSDRTTDSSSGDGTNAVMSKSQSWFDSMGMGDALAVTSITHIFCARNDADIIFNEGSDWVTVFPSETTDSDQRSLAEVAMHEFGHFLGLDEEDSNIATMNPVYPGGGDVVSDSMGYFRIGEDDYCGLVYGKADASTGVNLMLQRWRFGTYAGVEVWTGTDSGRTWTARRGETLAKGVGPSAILAVIHGTSTVTATVRWQLSADATCFSGTEYALGSESISLTANTPNSVGPTAGYTVPLGTPVGSYYLCAMVDYGDDVSETYEGDNIIVSEKLFVVTAF